MKRYTLFVYNQFYPKGGMNDFIGSSDTLEGCVPILKKAIDEMADKAYPKGSTDSIFFDVYDTLEERFETDYLFIEGQVLESEI